MYRRCFKSFLCIVLIIALCLSFTVPAFASSQSWLDDFVDGLMQPSVSAPAGITSAVSDLAFFKGLLTSLNVNCFSLFAAQGGDYVTSEDGFIAAAYRLYFNTYFTQNYSTTSTDRYIYVKFTDLQEFVRECEYLPLTMTYFPTTNVYAVTIAGTSLVERSGVRGYSEEKIIFYNSVKNAFGRKPFEDWNDPVEGAVLRGLPYFGDYILVAAPPDSEPPFYSENDKTNSAGTTEHNYYTDSSTVDNSVNDNSVTTNTTIYNGGDTFSTETFDYSNGTWYDNVTGTINDIESLHYNPVTNTYTVNNTYNISYEYNYTYYYNLGSSENLVQDYKFYYELPDGRSSSDLTADEIAGLSLAFDVVNYAEDRTDEHTKILVPFDGSWADIAYHGPELQWRTGASITYKESAAFNGSLYIPGDNPSIFGFSGPWYPSLTSQGMTLQFRYYCDAFPASNSYNNQSLIFSPFSYRNASGIADAFPYFYIKPDGSFWYGVGTNGSTQVGNSGSINSRLGTLSPGVWSDITVSVIPVSSSSVNIAVYVNGQRLGLISWPPSSYSGYYTPSYYPVFAFNTKLLTFFSRNISSFDWVSYIGYNSSPENMPYQMIDNLRVVDFALYDGSVNSNFIPTPVPFDTNLVYVLPDTTNLKDNTIAVQSGVPVSGYRIGGVRPTFPDKGMVWMPLENDKISDCQIYNGSYWESVGCRVWTGQRWVPAWAFNVVTLSDLWDIYGGEDSDNYTEITAGSFYQWFQQHFLELKTGLIDRLDRILEAMGVQVEGEEDITKPDGDGNAKFSLLQLVDRILAGVTKVPASVLSSTLGSISETVGGFVTGITDFFGGVEDMGEQSEPFFESMDGVLGNVSQLVHDTWEAIPEEAQDVLTTCFMLAVFGSCIVIFLG